MRQNHNLPLINKDSNTFIFSTVLPNDGSTPLMDITRICKIVIQVATVRTTKTQIKSLVVIVISEVDVSLSSGFNPSKKLVFEEVEFVAPLAVRNCFLACEGIDCSDGLADKLACLLDVEHYVLVGVFLRSCDKEVKFVVDGFKFVAQSGNDFGESVK